MSVVCINYLCLIFYFSSHNTRVFVNNGRTRNLLAMFCKSVLSEAEFQELVKGIELYQPSLSSLLSSVASNAMKLQCPEPLQDLVLNLSTNYPVCSILHYNDTLFSVLQDIVNGVDHSSRLTETCLIQTECPILGGVLKYFHL